MRRETGEAEKAFHVYYFKHYRHTSVDRNWEIKKHNRYICKFASASRSTHSRGLNLNFLRTRHKHEKLSHSSWIDWIYFSFCAFSNSLHTQIFFLLFIESTFPQISLCIFSTRSSRTFDKLKFLLRTWIRYDICTKVFFFHFWTEMTLFTVHNHLKFFRVWHEATLDSQVFKYSHCLRLSALNNNFFSLLRLS